MTGDQVRTDPEQELASLRERVARLDRAEAEKEAAVRLSRRLAGTLSYEGLLNVLREESDRLLGWDVFYLAHKVPDRDLFRIVGIVDTVDRQKQVFPGADNLPGDFSPAVQQVLEGHPLLVNRAANDSAPLLQPAGTDKPAASLIFVPVQCDGAVIGLLTAQSYTPGRYGESDLRILQDFADTVAPALERVYARDALLRSRALLALERDLALALSSTSDLGAALEHLLDISLRIEGIDCGGAYIVDESSGGLDLVCHRGLSGEFVENIAHVSADSRRGEFVAQAKPLYIPREQLEILDKACRREGLRALAAIPVVLGSRPIAVLNLASRTLDDIPHGARNALETIAAQTGAAMARIRAEAALREARNHLERRVAERTAELLEANQRLQAEIVERQRTRQALADSEQKHRLLIETNAIGYVILDEQGRVLDANEEYLRMTGRGSLADILGRPVTDWTAEQDVARNAEEVRKCLREGTLRGLEIMYRTPSGELIPVEINATMLLTQAGPRILSLVQDISDRKRAEQALRASERRYRTLAESAQDSIFIIDREDRVRYANSFAARQFGCTPEQLIGRRRGDLFPPEIALRQATHLEQVFSQGVPRTFENVSEFSDRAVWLHTQLVPMKDEHGRVEAVLGIARDVTETHRATEALKESEAHMRNLLSSLPLIVYSVEPGTNKLLVFQGAARQIFGMDPEVIRDDSTVVQRLVHPMHAERVAETWRKGLASGKPFELEVPIIRETDGQIVWLYERVVPLVDDQGKSLGHHGFVLDITGRKQAEEALLRKESELRRFGIEANRQLEKERTRISRELHDELGQMLTALNLNLVWLDKHTEKSNSAVMERLAESIDYVSRTITSVRSLSKSLRPAALSHQGLVEAVRAHVAEFEQYSGISCELAVAPGDLEVAEPMATTAFRIVQEALTNVARHSRATCCSLSFEAEDETLLLRVRDNGVGLGSVDMANLRSLGVVGMRERAAMVGGKLTVENAPEGGVLVTACLPLAPDGGDPAPS